MTSSSSANSGDNRPSNMFFWPTPERPTVARGEGIYLWDTTGKKYIDACSGPQTTSLGHGNARVIAAMTEQAQKVSYAFRSHFLNEPAELLAKEICDAAPAPFDRVFFTSGGSEAVETCIKLARQYAVATGQGSRYKLISRVPSYHGTTLGALSVTGDPAGFGMFAPMMVNQPKIPAPFCRYRRPGQSENEAAVEYAQALENEIINQGADTVLAFIIEPVGGASSGALVAPDVYYSHIREICDRYGVLLIFDEVMSGSGRTGKYLAAEYWPDAMPDLVALAKGLAAGYIPLGACLTSQGIVGAVEDAGGFNHGHTYSASPVACAVGRAVLAEHLENDLIGNAARMGEVLKGRLVSLLDEFPFMGEVRGKGLLLAFDVVADRDTGRPLPPALNAYLDLSQEAYERGLIIYSRRVMGGVRGDHFLVTPALTVKEAQIDDIVDLLTQALRAFAPRALKAMRA
ncbi:MAG: adenosylmethionine-8-amino-7-oxononanoate aminotransferase [Gammaproteobacteria bacterium]|jgi:adenosylmethionine-8-amino-7-oxononanoate aminotransferase